MGESISAFRSQSQSKSQSLAVIAPDYVVTNAGTAAANGDYYENGTYNTKPAYEKDGGGAWIFFAQIVSPYWQIDSAKATQVGTGAWYYTIAADATPPTGTWSTGDGDAPAADVAEG